MSHRTTQHPSRVSFSCAQKALAYANSLASQGVSCSYGKSAGAWSVVSGAINCTGIDIHRKPGSM